MPFDWPILVIALIPVAVWILATIFRGVEEAQEKNRPRPRGDGAPLQTPRRPASELDRFLNEARKRRDPPPPPRPEPMLAEPVILERAPAPPPRREPKPRPRVEPRPMPAPAVLTTPPVEAPPPPPPPPPSTVKPRAASPLLTRLNGMLRDRNSLALAFVLREVFDRPVGQRRAGGKARELFIGLMGPMGLIGPISGARG